jgi:plastocyanin
MLPVLVRGGFGIVGLGLAGVCFAVGFSVTSVLARVGDGRPAELVSAQALTRSDRVVNAWIEGFEFSPDRVKVPTGATVLWTNRDGVDHDVTLRDYDVASPLVGKGGEIAVAFREPGEFRYYCHVHPFMQGTVIVE